MLKMRGPRGPRVGGRRDMGDGPRATPVDRVCCFATREEEEMKRILAVLAVVAALAIPVAAQASAGPHHSHGQCASSSHGGCARTGNG